MGKYTEQQHQNVLQNLSTKNRIRAMRKLAAAPPKEPAINGPLAVDYGVWPQSVSHIEQAKGTL